MERSTADTKERSPVSHLVESLRPSLTTVSLEVLIESEVDMLVPRVTAVTEAIDVLNVKVRAAISMFSK